jgi:hypothetical protein
MLAGMQNNSDGHSPIVFEVLRQCRHPSLPRIKMSAKLLVNATGSKQDEVGKLNALFSLCAQV